MSITVPLYGFGGGGGAALNFKVVGWLEQPANPKENTIWVQTDVDITGWIFSATEPVEPVEGMVLFGNGTSSNVEFNALKKNSIQVYPFSAKQYVGGTWSAKAAYIFRDGAWVEFGSVTVYLYNNGDKCTDITGGWGSVKGHSSGVVTFKTKSIYTKGIYSDGHYGATALAYTKKAIDLTVYKTLILTAYGVSADSNVNCGIMISKSANAFDAEYIDTYDSIKKFNAGVSATSDGEISLDISKFTGAYYVLVGVTYGTDNGTSTLTANEVKLKS